MTVTQADLRYEDACGIDENPLKAADIKEFEKIELYNSDNVERFSTYAIKDNAAAAKYRSMVL